MTARIKAESLAPLKKNVFVSDLDRGMRVTPRGIIIPDDNMKEQGIHPRWGCVFAVGPEVDDLSPGDWVYVEHGRWTNGIDLELPDGTVRIWRVEYPKSVLLACDHDPRDTKAW
jgi:co-chaperonin GroES (HSP10)